MKGHRVSSKRLVNANLFIFLIIGVFGIGQSTDFALAESKSRDDVVKSVLDMIESSPGLINSDSKSSERSPLHRVVVKQTVQVTLDRPKSASQKLMQVSPLAKKKTTLEKDFKGYEVLLGATLRVNDESQILKFPVRVKGSEVWVVAREIALRLGALIFHREDGSFYITKADGKIYSVSPNQQDLFSDREKVLTLKDLPGVVDDELVVTPDAFSQIFDAALSFVAEEKTLSLETVAQIPEEGLNIKKITKPKVIEEKRVKPIVISKPREAAKQVIPKNVAPDLSVRTRVTPSYFKDHNPHAESQRTRNLKISQEGNVYDYSLRTDLNFNDRNRSFVFERGSVKLSSPDLKIQFLNNQINLNPLRQQSIEYQGAYVEKFWPNYSLGSTAFLSGLVESTAAGSVSNITYSGEVYGLVQKFKYNELIDQKIAYYRLEEEAENKVFKNGSNFPVENNILYSDTRLYLPWDLSLNGQASFIHAKPDNGSNSPLEDHNWRAEAKLDKEKLFGSFSYEFVGKDYVSLSPATAYSDFKGANALIRLTPWERTSGYVGYRQNRNNVENNESLSNRDSVVYSTGINTSIPTGQSINVNYSFQRDKTIAPATDVTGNYSRDFRVEGLQSWRYSSLHFSYESYKLSPIELANTNQGRDVYAVTFLKTIPDWKDFTFRLRQDWQHNSFNDSTQDTRSVNTDIGFSSTLSEEVSTSLDFRIATSQTKISEPTSKLSVVYRTDYDMGEWNSLRLEGRIDNYEIREKRSWPQDYSVRIQWTNQFVMGSPAKWGKVIGLIFRDTNANNVFDDGDVPAQDVMVKMDNQDWVMTNAQGEFTIEHVVPGKRTIMINEKELPVDLALLGDAKQEVVIGPLETKELSFRLILLGSLSGRVFFDQNENGLYDDGEGIKNTALTLRPTGQTVLTDDKGFYRFDYLFSGSYDLVISKETIPSAFRLFSPETWPVNLPASAKVQDINFVLQSKPIQVQRFD